LSISAATKAESRLNRVVRYNEEAASHMSHTMNSFLPECHRHTQRIAWDRESPEPAEGMDEPLAQIRVEVLPFPLLSICYFVG
jgi:hypothetical protein